MIHIINIIILFVLLRMILIKPVNRFLNARTERINGQLADAESKQKEAISLKQEYESHIQAYEQEGRDIIRDSQMKAEKEAQAIVSQARAQAESIVAEANAKIASEKATALAEARTEVALLATEIAARILKREVSVSDNRAVAEDFFRESR